MKEKYDEQISLLLDSKTLKDVDRANDNSISGISSDVLSSEINAATLEQWFYNSTLANTQIISLTSGDPAFYASNDPDNNDLSTGVDFQKRNKQVWSPGTLLDRNVVRAQYKTVYINDNYVKSKSYNDYKDALDADKTLDDDAKKKILDAYESGINEGDAQGYISLDRYMEIQRGLGRWTDAHQETYDKLMNGESTGKNWKLFQPIKPFYFNHQFINGRVVPTQNKNTEII